MTNFVCSVEEAYGAILDITKYRVVIYDEGEVWITPAGKTTTTCLLDVTYFPFDSQACYVEVNRYIIAIIIIRTNLILSHSVKIHCTRRARRLLLFSMLGP